MEPQLAGTRRKRESILAGGRRIQKVRSRSSSRGPGSRQSEPLLEFLDDILNFSKVLLRQQTNPLREDLVLGQIIYLENLQAYDSHPMTSETESVGTINIDTSSTSSENWTTSCLAIKAELNRLVMWKFDITQKRLSAAFKEESLLYTVLCETILGIGETIKSLPSPEFVDSSTDVNLQLLYKKLNDTIKRFGKEPSANTRSHKRSFDSDDDDVAILKLLRDDINRLVHLVASMVQHCEKNKHYQMPGLADER